MSSESWIRLCHRVPAQRRLEGSGALGPEDLSVQESSIHHAAIKQMWHQRQRHAEVSRPLEKYREANTDLAR